MEKIRFDMDKNKANCYFDISKFYIRGLHVGFSKSKVLFFSFLVRDPLQNMKSF